MRVTSVAIAMAIVWMTPAAVAQSKPAPAKPAPAKPKQWRTPWGDPDLQGSWSNATTTPLQRPDRYAGREYLTAAERAEQDKNTAIGTDKRDPAVRPRT